VRHTIIFCAPLLIANLAASNASDPSLPVLLIAIPYIFFVASTHVAAGRRSPAVSGGRKRAQG
jgi:hypothetical protein